MKRDQGCGLTEAQDWDKKTHVRDDPTDKRGKAPQEFPNPRIRFYRYPMI